MNIDFNSIPLSVLPGFKGGEKELRAKMFADCRNRIFKGLLVPGASIGVHTHDTGSEIIFIIKGSGTVIEDGVERPVEEGICHYCEKGHTHSLINTSDNDLEFYAVVAEQ